MHNGPNVDQAPILELGASTVTGNLMGGVYIVGPGSIRLEGNEISGGMGLDTVNRGWAHGDAVFATRDSGEGPASWDEAVGRGLLIEDNLLQDSSGAAVFLDGSRATLVGNVYQANATDLLVQDCSGVQDPEGVETEAQLDLLAKEGWQFYQGFLCARPLDGESLINMIEQGKEPVTAA